MANNDLYDWTVFTDPSTGIELLNNSVRESMKADTYAGRTKFVAVALTDLIPMTAIQAMGLDGANTSIVSSTSNKRFAFKGRIIGDKSPHLFLPNPCDPAYATDDKGAWSIISLHTTFLTQVIDEPPPISRGDIVNVELEKSEATIYNLQVGKIVGLASQQDATGAGAAATSGSFCGLLGSLFDGGGVSGSVGGYTPMTAAPCPSCNSPIDPAKWKVTSEFYHPRYGTCRCLSPSAGATTHHGIDLACKSTDALYSIFDGTVTVTGIGSPGSCWNGKTCSGCKPNGGGNALYITATDPDPASGKKVIAKYKHLTSIKAGINGAVVKAGDPIGFCGNTGCSTGPHLHFEVHVTNGKMTRDTAVDPCEYLGRGSCKCLKAGKRSCGYRKDWCKGSHITVGSCITVG